MVARADICRQRLIVVDSGSLYKCHRPVASELAVTCAGDDAGSHVEMGGVASVQDFRPGLASIWLSSQR